MNFGMVGFNPSGSVSSSDPETEQKLYGYGLFKKQDIRSGNEQEDGSWRNSKAVKTDEEDLSHSNNSLSLLTSNNPSLFSNDFHQQQNQMLSFTCSKSPSQTAALPHFPLPEAYSCSRNTGNNSSKGVWNGFTPLQWMELEQQALIFKYIKANIPIPSHLLLPIRKAFESVALSGLSAGVLRPSNTLGWGAFHLGYSASTDPEPGRCRRTDGKKWRCSREAVVDQKYCERHINRGRHRSRKPVEGQQQQQLVLSHSPAAATKTTTTTATSTVAVAVGPVWEKANSGSNNRYASSQHQLKTPQQSSLNRISLNKEQGDKLHDPTSLSIRSTTSMDWKTPEENLILNAKQLFPFEESSHNKFEFVSSEPSHDLSQKKPSPLIGLNIQETHHPLQFLGNWPMNQSDMNHMSISSDLLSSISTNSEKIAVLPISLSHEPSEAEFDHLRMRFGMGGAAADVSTIDWESSNSGPFGEVLHDNHTSPRCVLQKTSFVTVSNSSTGSSPGTIPTLVHEGFSFCS